MTTTTTDVAAMVKSVRQMQLELRLSEQVFRQYGMQHHDKMLATEDVKERHDREHKAKRNFERADCCKRALDFYAEHEALLQSQQAEITELRAERDALLQRPLDLAKMDSLDDDATDQMIAYYWHEQAQEARAKIARLSAMVEERGKVVKQAEAAISEYYRYWTGGETRGSYDGKPERKGLWEAMYAARQAISTQEPTP